MSLLQTAKLKIVIAGKTICEALNLAISGGEIWGLPGANGCGKTRLLLTLAGLRRPDSGNIYFQGRNILQLNARETALQRGIVFQQTTARFPQTVYEFCLGHRYPHKTSAAENHRIVLDALEIMELKHKLASSIQTLSGGEMRRLALAGVIAQAPAIYLLDEPLNHLDPRYQLILLETLSQLVKTKSAAVLMSLHDMRVLTTYCSHVLVPQSSGVFLQGETGKIITPALLSTLYDCQVSLSNTSTFVFG